MAVQSWSDLLKASTKTDLIHDGKRKIHYLFTDGKEMWCSKSTLKGQGPWEIEVGEPVPSTVACLESDVLEKRNENCSNYNALLYFLSLYLCTKTSFLWRVRNLPYPIEVYNISVEPYQRCCIIRTNNKKYYKKFNVPDLDRSQLPLDSSALNFTHANNTLIVSYKKPKEILTIDHELLREVKKLKGTNEGDVDYKTP
uniref:Protein DPCD n=1 Tax=Salmo trutta TaxID=8032 RepID=A0A674BHB8_SALTR